jgi:hypothetical protein
VLGSQKEPEVLMEGSTGSPTAGEHEPLDGDEEEGEEEGGGAEQDDKVA